MKRIWLCSGLSIIAFISVMSYLLSLENQQSLAHHHLWQHCLCLFQSHSLTIPPCLKPDPPSPSLSLSLPLTHTYSHTHALLLSLSFCQSALQHVAWAMLRSTVEALLPAYRPRATARAPVLHLKDLHEDPHKPQLTPAIQEECSGSMWREAMRKRTYLLERSSRAGECAGGGRQRSPDWLYESYYCMSQQHPLIVFLLLIVMGACLALLAVFFASGLVSVWTPGGRWTGGTEWSNMQGERDLLILCRSTFKTGASKVLQI